MSRTIADVTDEELAKAWQGASSAKQAAETLDVGRTAVSSRVARLRKQGVKLRKFSTKGRVVDVGGLNAYIEGLGAPANGSPRAGGRKRKGAKA